MSGPVRARTEKRDGHSKHSAAKLRKSSHQRAWGRSSAQVCLCPNVSQVVRKQICVELNGFVYGNYTECTGHLKLACISNFCILIFNAICYQTHCKFTQTCQN